MTPEEVLQQSARTAAQDQSWPKRAVRPRRSEKPPCNCSRLCASASRPVVYALAALVLAALGAAAWMLWRMRQLAQQARSDWEAAIAREASTAKVAPVPSAPAPRHAAPAPVAPAAHGPAPVPVSQEIHPRRPCLQS
jgi:uncharacterized protein HemX